jgi:hypothetical protein
LILILLFAFSGTMDVLKNEMIATQDKEIVVTFVTEDGQTIQKQANLTEMDQWLNTLPEKLLTTTCTWVFSTGECEVTASTCEAARAGFYACACASGHDHFCGGPEDEEQ